jgi:hypothetical protein
MSPFLKGDPMKFSIQPERNSFETTIGGEMETLIGGKRIFRLSAVLMLCAAAQLACSLSGESAAGTGGAVPTPQPSEAVPATAAAEPTEAPQEPTAEPGAGEIACFGTGLYGVTCLSDEGWKTYNEENSDLPSDAVYDMAACPDGKIYAATPDGPASFDGEEWIKIATEVFSAFEYVACAPDGSVWFGYYKGVGRYADGGWRSFTSDEYTSAEFGDLTMGLDIAPDGTVWVATAESVSMYDGSTWTEYTEGSGFDDSISPEALAVDSQGRVWVSGFSEIYLFENGEWTKTEFEGFLSVRSLAVDPQDRVWVNADEGVFIYDGSEWSLLSYANGEIHGNAVWAAAFDDAGRTWLGMAYGIDVLVDGSWIHYRMDNADLADNAIRSLAVSGGGPALPEPMTKDPGSLIGSVSMHGAPLANARIEVCVESIAMFFTGATPCSGQPFQKGTETDSDGRFSFSGLPEGYYVVTIDKGDGWAQLGSLSSERVLVNAGKETDLGEVVIKDD